jgi:hypothetical protein
MRQLTFGAEWSTRVQYLLAGCKYSPHPFSGGLRLQGKQVQPTPFHLSVTRGKTGGNKWAA